MTDWKKSPYPEIAVFAMAKTVASASVYVVVTRHPRYDPVAYPDDYPRILAVSDHQSDGCSRSFQPGSCPLLTDTNTMLPYGAELTF